MAFTVININDDGIIKIIPKWKWIDIYGDLVKIEGIDINFEARAFTIDKLKTILLLQSVELKNPKQVEDQIIYCSVFLNEIDISIYFPELDNNIL